MNTKSKILITWITLAVLLLASCTPGADSRTSNSMRAWLDQPPDGYSLPLESFPLVAHARQPGGGVTLIRFLVNGVELGSAPADASVELTEATLDWNPSVPGEYTIQAVAVNSAGQEAFSEIARVCVGDPEKSGCSGVSGSGETTESETGDVMKVGADPNILYAGAGCTPETVTINFEGYVENLEGAIEVYIHGYMYNDAEESREIVFMLNPEGDGYIGSYTLTPEDIAFFASGGGKIIYTLALLNDQKEFFKNSAQEAIEIAPCGSVSGEGILKVGGVPNPVYIGKCSKGEPTAIDFEAGTDIPASSINRIDLAYVWFDAAGTWVGTAVGAENRAAMTPAGGGGYAYHLDVNTAPDAVKPGGTIKFRAIAVNAAGTDFAYSEVSEISIVKCGSTPVKTPTKTPTSQQKQITPSVTPYVPPPLSCTDYNKDPDGCKIAGCYFWSDGYTCSENPEPPPLSCTDYNKDPDGCKMAGCYFWSDGYTCSEDQEPPPPSVSCGDYTQNPDGCNNAGCYYWKDGTCSEKPE